MNESSSASFFERTLRRTGGRYLLLMFVVMQLINTLILLLLVAIPAQQNAEFTKAQGTSLLIFGAVALMVRSVVVLLGFIEPVRI